MLQLVRNSNPLSLLLIILYAFLVRSLVLIHPAMPVAYDYSQPLSFVTDTFCKFSQTNILYHYLTSTIVILLLAFYFNYVLNRNKIVEKNGFLPALFFILTLSLFGTYGIFSVELLAFVFVFIATIILYNTLLNDNNHAGTFDTGFFLGIAVMIYKPLFFLLLFVLACIIILRSVQIRDLVLSLLGFIIPFFLVGTYFFWSDRFALFYNNLLPHLTTSTKLSFNHAILEYFKIILLGVLVMMGIVKGQTESIKSIVPVRKFYGLSLLLIMGLVPCVFFCNILTINSFLFYAIPFSFYLYAIVKDVKRMWIAELIHVILLGLIFFTAI